MPDDDHTSDQQRRNYETYKTLYGFTRGLDHNVTLFAGTMYRIMRDRLWETGWKDDVLHRVIKAPTLRDFIEQDVPHGIGRTIGWVEAAFEAARHLRVLNADRRIQPEDESMIDEGLRLLQEAKTTPSLYTRPVANRYTARRRRKKVLPIKTQPRVNL